jgi:DNA replication protein DnaC
MTTRTRRPATPPIPTPTPAELRQQILEDFETLRIPLRPEQFDAALARAEHEGLSHLEFVRVLISEQANQRRERSIAHRIREARFREGKTLADFDWQFNAASIDRVRIEALATAAFIGRRENLVLVGQSGVGKSRIIEAIGRSACVLGYRVRYTTSADVLADLRAALADQTLPRRLREYAHYDLLIIDEFGFDQIERSESRQAASLLYKLIDARSPKRSTALVTNIDFEAWGEYLGDPPLAMAFLDRIVDGAIIVKINGKSYRAHRAQPASPGKGNASGGPSRDAKDR